LVVVRVPDLVVLDLVDLAVVVISLVVLDKVLMSQDKEILVVMVPHQVVQHMDLEVVVVLEALDKTEHHLRVVMEVLVFNFHQHSKIQDHQLDSLDQDQQLSLLLVVVEEFLTMQHQPPDKVVDLADLMLEQDLVHIILIQELQDFLLKQIVDLEEVVVDHQQHQVVQVVQVSFSSHTIQIDK
tara:strand:+ start:106 stop:654 length:549 start_codon:yes stop_codon:yes gene_type:complete